jgi:hypothetical protein
LSLCGGAERYRVIAHHDAEHVVLLLAAGC